MPGITLDQALNMQKELYCAFSEQDFQDELEEVEAKHGKGYANLTPHHTKLFLTVQSAILPKYGYDEGQKGVTQMFQDVSRFNSNEQFHKNRIMLNELLGLLSPEEMDDGDQEQESSEESFDGIELIVHHMTEDTSVTVRLPADATFYDVREALAKQTGNYEILDKGRLVRKQDGVFSAYNDKHAVGDVRKVLLLNASLEKQQATVDPALQKPAAIGHGHLNGNRFMFNLVCPPTLMAERRPKTEGGSGTGVAPRTPEPRPEPKQAMTPAPKPVREAKMEQKRETASVPKLDAPNGRFQRGERHFVVLGGDDGSCFHDSTEMLQLTPMKFLPGPQMVAKRSSCAAGTLQDGRVFLFGGCVGAKCLESTEFLQPGSMAWVPGPDMSTRRAACAAARIEEHRLMVLGGRDRSSKLDTTEILDTRTMAFSPGPQLATRRAMCSAVMLNDGQLLVIGGHDGFGALDTTEVLNLRTMEFAPGPLLGAPRFSCAAITVDGGHVLVIGGVGDDHCRLNTTEVLQLERGTFAPGPRMGGARSSCGVMRLDEKRIMVLGGADGSCRHDTTEILDIPSMVFTPGPRMISQRGGCVAVSC